MTLRDAIEKYGKKKGLYLLHYYDSIRDKHFYKLGYSKDITSRFKFYPITVEFLHFFEGDYYDKPCHDKLRKWGFKFEKEVVVLNDTEWMHAKDNKEDNLEHLKWATEAINVVYGEIEDYRLIHLPEFKNDSLQSRVIEETLEDFDNGSNRHMIHAETGSGKTYMAFKIAIRLDTKVNMIFTWKPGVLLEFEKYINGNENGYLPHKDIKGKFDYTEDPTIALDWLINGNEKDFFIGVSAYKLMAEVRGSKKVKLWKEVFKYKIDLLIPDEVHFGASGWAFLGDLLGVDDTNNIDDEFISKFNFNIEFDKLLSLSATPFPNIAYSNYYDGHRSTITYPDQCELRDDVISGRNTNAEDQRYKYLPTKRYWIKEIKDDVYAQSVKAGKTDFAITDLYLEDNLKPQAAQTIRGLRVAKDGDTDLFGDEDHIVFDGTEKEDHVIIRTNRRKAATNLCNLFTSDNFFENYVKYDAIVNGYDKNKLEALINEHKKSMFFTAGGLMTGTDIEKWNKLIYFCEPHSPCTQKQDEGRLMRLKEGKEFADIIFNSPDQSLTISTITKSWLAIKPKNETDESWIQENLKYCSVAIYGKGYKELKWQDINNAINKVLLRNASDGKISEQLFTPAAYSFLKENNFFGITTDKHGKLVFGKSGFGKKGSKTKIGKKRTNNKGSKKEENTDDMNLFTKISSIFIMYIKVQYAKTKINDVYHLINSKINELVELLNSDIETVNKLVKFIDISVIQRLIDTNAIEELPIFYDGSFMAVKKDLATRMSKKFNKSNYGNIGIFGGGSNLIEQMLNFSNDITYIYFSEEEHYVLENLYPCINFKKWSLNIIMEFDAIIMNPPYGRLHLKILKKCIKDIIKKDEYGNLKGELVTIQPIPWLQDPLIELKNKKDNIEMKSLLEGRTTIEIIDKNEASKSFGIAIPMNLGIYKIGPKTKISLNTVKQHVIAYRLLNKDNLKNGGFIYTTVGESKTGNFVLLSKIGASGGHRKESHVSSIVREAYGVFVNFKNKHGRTVIEQKKMIPRSTNGKPENWPCIEFETGKETENFWEYCHLPEMLYYVRTISIGVSVETRYLPFPKERDAFRDKWTSERFHKYFKTTPEEKSAMRETGNNK